MSKVYFYTDWIFIFFFLFFYFYLTLMLLGIKKDYGEKCWIKRIQVILAAGSVTVSLLPVAIYYMNEYYEKKRNY